MPKWSLTMFSLRYRLHPTKWKLPFLISLCFAGSLVVYKSVNVGMAIHSSIDDVRDRELDLTKRHLILRSPNTVQLKIPDFSTFTHTLENECKFPTLVPWESDLLGLNAHGSITCTKQMPDFATLDEDHLLKIHNDFDARWKAPYKVKCNASALSGTLRPKVARVFETHLNATFGFNTRVTLDADQFVLRCYSQPYVQKFKNGTKVSSNESALVYERPFAGFAQQQALKAAAPAADPMRPSLVLLVLDSTSRNQFQRHATRSLRLMDQLGFVQMRMYTKIADNSAVNLLPVVAGRSTTPRVGGDGREFLNATKHGVEHEELQHLWDLFKERSCVTMFNDDVMHPSRGLFAYHHHEGFRRPPTHYFFRPYDVYNARHHVSPSQGHCTKQGESVHGEHLKLFARFSRVYKDHCHFSINFLTTLTHDYSAHLQATDEPLRDILESFKAIGVLESTAVVIMGDHGNRIGPIMHTYTGRVEERTPFFSILVPERARQAHPELMRNLKRNANRLVSNYDIYRTLKELALGFQEDRNASQYRGYNLFRELVPTNRTCTEAGVPDNFCVCMSPQARPVYERGSAEWNQTLAKLTAYLAPLPCLDPSTLSVEEERLSTLNVNDMVRRGLREVPKNATEPTKAVFKEARYIDLHVRINSKGKPFENRLKFRVKYNAVSKIVTIPTTPLVLEQQGEHAALIQLDQLCGTNVAYTVKDGD